MRTFTLGAEIPGREGFERWTRDGLNEIEKAARDQDPNFADLVEEAVYGADAPSRPWFWAHRNGTAITTGADVTHNNIAWVTVNQVGGYFASNLWTPPAGKVLLIGSAYVTGTGLNYANVTMWRNAGAIAQNNVYPTVATGHPISTVVVDASGAQAFKITYFGDITSGSVSVDGSVHNTYFMGYWLGP